MYGRVPMRRYLLATASVLSFAALIAACSASGVDEIGEALEDEQTTVPDGDPNSKTIPTPTDSDDAGAKAGDGGAKAKDAGAMPKDSGTPPPPPPPTGAVCDPAGADAYAIMLGLMAAADQLVPCPCYAGECCATAQVELIPGLPISLSGCLPEAQ